VNRTDIEEEGREVYVYTQAPHRTRMHLGASRSYDSPLRWESILTVAAGRMIHGISEEFVAELRSYADFTQSRSRNNLEASINGAAGVFLQVAMHASHGESGLAEWPGFSQNTAKLQFGTENGDFGATS